MTADFKYIKPLLLSGLLFTLHNIEESIGFAYFTYPQNLKLPVNPPSAFSMITAIIIVTLLGWGLITWTVFQKNETIKRNILAVVGFLLLFNAIFPHIAGAIFLKQYFPAVVTSVILYIPFCIWIIPKVYRLFQSGKEFLKVISYGFIIGFGIVGILQFVINSIY